MKDMFKHISSCFLYDDQLNFDYLLFYNRKQRKMPIIVEGEVELEVVPGEYDNSLPYDFSISDFGVLDKIYELRKEKDTDYMNKSISFMENACKRNNIPFIKLIEPLTLIKVKMTHLPNYNAYDIYFNETKNNFEIGDIELAAHWNVGSSQYGIFRIHEYQ